MIQNQIRFNQQLIAAQVEQAQRREQVQKKSKIPT